MNYLNGAILWDRFEYGLQVGPYRIERGGAACTLVLVDVSIRLRVISEFKSIARFSTTDTVQQISLLQRINIRRFDRRDRSMSDL